MLLLLLYIIRYKIQKNLQKKALKGIKKTDANGINKPKKQENRSLYTKNENLFQKSTNENVKNL